MTAEEEDLIVDHLIILGDFGVPLQPIDVRHLVKIYLDMAEKEVPSFVGDVGLEIYENTFGTRRISLHVVRNIKVIIPSLVDLWHDIGHIDHLRVSKGHF